MTHPKIEGKDPNLEQQNRTPEQIAIDQKLMDDTYKMPSQIDKEECNQCHKPECDGWHSGQLIPVAKDEDWRTDDGFLPVKKEEDWKERFEKEFKNVWIASGLSTGNYRLLDFGNLKDFIESEKKRSYEEGYFQGKLDEGMRFSKILKEFFLKD